MAAKGSAGENGQLQTKREWKIHTGPIPSADDLEKYEKVIPGAADRIITMAEEQGDHRRRMERDVLAVDKFKVVGGQWFGFIIAITGMVIGGLLLGQGQSPDGFVAMLTPLGVIVGAFVWSRRSKQS